jgi:hypothetical protein
MIPSHHTLALFGMLGLGGLLTAPRPTKTERALRRLDLAEAAYYPKLASPEYHAALAKRERKRQRLLAL